MNVSAAMELSRCSQGLMCGCSLQRLFQLFSHESWVITFSLKLWSIELDGSQHLGSVEAYRRDRRKDRLLQENGYKILRFLAEDVGKRLDDVLDTILRAL
jgi:very-short-patch-repair endonuclease